MFRALSFPRTIRTLRSILLGWPLPRLGTFGIEYAGLTRFPRSPAGAKLQPLNFTPWRELFPG